MPRIRISAAKNAKRNDMFIGMSRRNIIGSGKDGDKMIGGLTPGNLQKIQIGTIGNTGFESAIQTKQHSPMDGDDSSDMPPKKIRKQFARGISLEGDRNASQLKHISEIAPSAHHRFDKESVHLRSMYR